MRLDALNELQMDALGEIGGIGAGHAATALSQLVDRPIKIEVPRPQIVPVNRISGLLGGAERQVCAVFTPMFGDINGAVLFVLDDTAARALIDLMHCHEVGTLERMGSDEEALLRHVGSILIAAQLAAIGRMTSLDVLPAGSSFAFDMAGALLGSAVIGAGVEASETFFVRTAFIDAETRVDASLFFIPRPESMRLILGRSGIA